MAGRVTGRKPSELRKAAEKKKKKKKKSGAVVTGRKPSEIIAAREGKPTPKPEPKEEPKKEDVIRLGEPKEDVIRLGGEPEKKGIIESLKGITEKFNIQKQLEKSGSDIKVKEMIYTGPVIGATSLIGRTIPEKSIQAAGKAAGLSKEGIAQVKHAIGVRRVSEVAQSLINPKSQSLMLKVAKKVFSPKTLALFGAGISTVFLGKWGQAEGPEAIVIPQRDALRLAGETGNYDLYWEAAAAREELTDLSLWEKILLWTPFISPFIGIPNKIKGVREGGRILDEVAKQQQIQNETGESEDEKWVRIEEERTERREKEKEEDEEYYAQIEKNIKESKKEARKEEEKYFSQIQKEAAAAQKKQRAEDEAYWAKILRDREMYETAKRAAEEKYWENVRKLNAELKKEELKQYQDYTRSNLNFGLL